MLEGANKFRLIALVTGFLLVVGVVNAWSEQPTPSVGRIGQQQQSQPQAEQPIFNKLGTEDAPVVVKVLPAPVSPEEAANNAQDRESKAMLEWRTLVLAIATIIVLILQLFVYGLQATRLRQTIETMQSSERRQLRAYVGVEDLALEWPSGQDKNYKPPDMSHPGLIHKDFIVVTIKNFGQTPAKDTTVFAYFTDTKFPERLPDDFFEHNDVDVVSAAHVRPTLARFLLQRGQAEISKSVIQDIRPLRLAKPRERYIYVFGRIYYRDIYDKNWRTKFCYVWEPWHPSGPRFVPYEAYNDEDQNELLYE